MDKSAEPRAKSLRFAAPSCASVLVAAALGNGCAYDSRTLGAQNVVPARQVNAIAAESTPLCTMIGPASASPGVYGTDLGFSARDPDTPDRLAILFGDTWARPGGGCQYPVFGSDDLEASLPALRPRELEGGTSTGREAEACRVLDYAHADSKDRTSWRPIRLFDVDQRTKKETLLDTGALRTPLAAFSDEKTLFTFYGRGELAYCKASSDCPARTTCSSSSKVPVGVCARRSGAATEPAPAYCRNVTDCRPGLQCLPADRGVCLSTSPFELRTANGFVSPPWYRDDPRLGFERITYLAARVSRERATDYAVAQRLVTNRFVNVTAKTVAHFDEAHPENNDYRPGSHALLVWGRSTFAALEGSQNLPFLFHASLDDIRQRDGSFRIHPRYFAGYDETGAAKWSDDEEDAEPVYGTDARISADGTIDWQKPEFDYDNQMTASYLAPFGRWILLYGGDVPAFMIRDPHTGETPDPTYPEPSPGAIHLRTAAHPWGRLREDSPKSDGFGSPLPILTRRDAARFMACPRDDGGEMPGCLTGERADPRDPNRAPVSVGTAMSCVFGDWVLAGQRRISGNPIGRLYGPNVIDEWTEDVTARTSGLAGDSRAVAIYWNVSTWNPYQVILVESVLRGPAAPK